MKREFDVAPGPVHERGKVVAAVPAFERLDPVTLADEVLKEKATNGTLKVTLSEDAAPGSLTHFRIVGKAKIGERDVQSATRTTPALKKLFPAMPFPPRELDGSIALGVKAKQ